MLQSPAASAASLHSIAQPAAIHCTESPLPLRPFILSASSLFTSDRSAMGQCGTVQPIPRCRPCSPALPELTSLLPCGSENTSEASTISPFTLHATARADQRFRAIQALLQNAVHLCALQPPHHHATPESKRHMLKRHVRYRQFS